MSVPKGDRNESDAEFIYRARELQAYTIRKCLRFPKRYTFYIGKPMALMAGRAYEYVARKLEGAWNYSTQKVRRTERSLTWQTLET